MYEAENAVAFGESGNKAEAVLRRSRLLVTPV